MKKIAIAADHAGFELKEYLKIQLAGKYEITDYGTHSADSVDYPDFVHPAASSIESGENVLITTGGGDLFHVMTSLLHYILESKEEKSIQKWMDFLLCI